MTILGSESTFHLDYFERPHAWPSLRQWVRLPIRDEHDWLVYVQWDGQRVLDVAVEEPQEGKLIAASLVEVPGLTLAATLWLEAKP